MADNAERIPLEQVGVDNGIHHDTPQNCPREDGRHSDLPPTSIRLKLTGYRLCNLLCPLAFLIAKEVNSHKSGKPWTMMLSDWFQVGLFGAGSYLLSCFEKDNVGRWPYLFEVDYIPLFGGFVCRPTVARSLPALISIIPVWTAAVRIQVVLDVTHSDHLYGGLRRKILIAAALSLSIAILSLVHRFNMVFSPRHSTVLEKWLPPMAAVFGCALVVMTKLLIQHHYGTYISAWYSSTPFGAWRVHYDLLLSSAPIIMMIMGPEPRFRMAYAGLSITGFGLSVWGLYVLRNLHSVPNVSHWYSIVNLIFMTGAASCMLFEFLRMVYNLRVM